MAAKKPAREKPAPKKRAPASKKPATPKNAKRVASAPVKKPFADLRFGSVVPVSPTAPMLDRINAMADRINAALLPVLRQIREEATTQAEAEDIVRLLHQLFASNCGRFEAMLVTHKLSMSYEAGSTHAELKRLGVELGDYYSAARCEVFNASFEHYLQSGGQDEVQPTAVAYAPESRNTRKRNDSLN
jgi:hypothetical protein